MIRLAAFDRSQTSEGIAGFDLFTPIGPIVHKSTTGNVNLPTSLDTFYHQLVRLCEPQDVLWFIALLVFWRT